MTVIKINKRWWTFPQTWDELTPRQAVAVMKVMCAVVTPAQSRLHLIRILSGCGWWNYWRQVTRFNGMALIYNQLHLCDFIFNKPRLIKNPLPIYKGYHGPADNFDNLRMNEYAFAQNYYEQYTADDAKNEALDGLLATIYRPRVGMESEYATVEASNTDDLRIPFTEAGMKARVKVVSKWPVHIKELIFFWYTGCMQQLMDDNADVFNGSGGEPALHGIVSVMRNVAKEGTYGDFEKVELMYVKMLMLELKESKHEAAQLDKQ